LLIIGVSPLLIQNKWFFFRTDQLRIGQTLERCLTMIFVPFEKKSDGWDLGLGDGSIKITLTQLSAQVGIMNFRGKRSQKKFQLLKALLIKSFAGIFPRPIIHLGPRHDQNNESCIT
jgi:hypothetical protein